MIARTGSGWQYILADLSLILFMVTAAALAQAQDVAPKPRPAMVKTQTAKAPAPSSQGEPVAIYRAGLKAPPLHDWLRSQLTDPRQELTIVSQYRPGGQVNALILAQNMARDAGEAGKQARIVVEPGSEAASAVLAFDTPESSRPGK